MITLWPKSCFCAARLLFAAAALVLLPVALRAAPFSQQIHFTQPDGTQIVLHGWGDEFHATFETLDGYTVVYDDAQRAYCYARRDAGGRLPSWALHNVNALKRSPYLSPTSASNRAYSAAYSCAIRSSE